MTPDQLAKSLTEHAEQRALFAWANMASRFGVLVAANALSYTKQGHAVYLAEILPPNIAVTQLAWLHAIHNQGHGDAVRGGKAKAEGVKAGVADLFLPVAKQGCFGLYIEMKRLALKTDDLTKVCSKEQLEFRTYCEREGYAWQCCFGWREASACLINYLGLV